MISDEPNYAEARHCVAEFNLLVLPIELFNFIHVQHLLDVLLARCFVSLADVHLFPSLIQFDKPSVAVVDQLDQGFFTRLAGCAMIQKYFENIHHCGFMIKLYRG